MSDPSPTTEAVPIPVPSSRPPRVPPTLSFGTGQPRGALPTTGDLHAPREVELHRTPIVEEYMHTCLVTTGPGARLSAVAALLRFHGYSGVPVVEGMHLVGVLSEKDILRALAENGGLSVASEVLDHVLESPSRGRTERRARWKGVLERMRVRDVMTSPPVVTTVDTSLDGALRWMLVKHVQRLPVMDGPHLVGIITRGDVLKAVGVDR